MKLRTCLAVIAAWALAGSVAAQTGQFYRYDVHGRLVASTRGQTGTGGGAYGWFGYDPAVNRTTDWSNATGTRAAINILGSGEVLTLGQTLTSLDSRLSFRVQPDGNLVITFLGGPIWAVGTAGAQSVFLAMQTDGNLVLYGAQHAVIWASNTGGYPGAYLVQQNDGNLVIYSGGTPIWASGSCCY